MGLVELPDQYDFRVRRPFRYDLDNKDPDYLWMRDNFRCKDCGGIATIEEYSGSGGVAITCVGRGYGSDCPGKWWVEDESLD